METISKELHKLEGKSCGPALDASLVAVQGSIDALERWRAALMDGDDMQENEAGDAALQQLQATSSKLAENSKEWSSALTKYGKSVDKKFATDITPLLPLPPAGASQDDDIHLFFASPESRATIDSILSMHFVRSAREEVAEAFLKEAGVIFPREKLGQFSTLRRVIDAIRQGDLGPAFEWSHANVAFLESTRSALIFHLHRSNYVRLLLSDTYPLPPSLQSEVSEEVHPHPNGTTGKRKRLQGPHRALAYARKHFGAFLPDHSREVARLSASALFLPIQNLLTSPYGDMFSPDGMVKTSKSANPPAGDPTEDIFHAPHLTQLFASDFCRSVNMSKDLPLKVVTDIGGGGALAKIAKVRGVMKEKRTEWTTSQELPVEIHLPTDYRYHSIFACPVSKEQATDANPPMMMPCGHVVADQTLRRLCKGGQNVRCPYCPLSSAVSNAIRVRF